MGPALERFVIHFFSAGSLVFISYFFFRFIHRKYPRLDFILVVSCLSVFALSTLREAYDVYNGQPLYKAFTDYTSWALGVIAIGYGIYRLSK